MLWNQLEEEPAEVPLMRSRAPPKRELILLYRTAVEVKRCCGREPLDVVARGGVERRGRESIDDREFDRELREKQTAVPPQRRT